MTSDGRGGVAGGLVSRRGEDGSGLKWGGKSGLMRIGDEDGRMGI